MTDRLKIKRNNANCTEITWGEHTVLFSYETPVAYRNRIEDVRCEGPWSKTTVKHLNGSGYRFCKEVSREDFAKLIERATT
jgi:hypothetical protein